MVTDQDSLMEGTRKLLPALVIADVSLAQGDIRHLLQSLRECAPLTRVLLLSVHDEPTVVEAAFAAGADGLVLKRSIADDLLPAVDAVLAGRRFASSSRRH